ncbi:MAG: amino acid ABC transporter permease [Planctomycetes bacterium]|nr:amino acid ABC transporter permease [Planctomycetota bacterium]MCC8116528.1 amino acid ABC transporter permease [Planctomycetota bacterium]
MDLSAEYVSTLLPGLLRGLRETLLIFSLTLLLSLPLGLPVALGSISRFWPVRILSRIYVWLFRGTPLMLQLFFFYYGLGILANTYEMPYLRLNRFSAVILTFALNYAAYFAEIYRAGIQSIDRGQYEAAKTLGFSRTRTMFRIIIPQTIRRIIPPVSNETITLVKDTALANVIAVPELLKVAKDASNRDTNPSAYLLAAGGYLIITFVLTVVYQRLEKRFSRHEQEAV